MGNMHREETEYTEQLKELMQQVKISSFRQLMRVAGVSQWQVLRLRQGKAEQMRVEQLLKISQALQVSLLELLEMFSSSTMESKKPDDSDLKQEYLRLQAQLLQQQEQLHTTWQNSSLQVIESWLLQWPTAAYAAQQNPQLPAVKLLPLVKPIEKLLQEWGIETIASVGEHLPYNPQWHQLLEGTAQAGELVRVRYVGYRQGEKLLYRAKVSPVS